MTTRENKAGTTIRTGDLGRYSIYQPVNLGVFSLGHGAVCGDIQIMLNPNPNFKTACVESANFTTDGVTAGNDMAQMLPGTANFWDQYRFDINSIVFIWRVMQKQPNLKIQHTHLPCTSMLFK